MPEMRILKRVSDLFQHYFSRNCVNPFLVDFPDKILLSNDDYEVLQSKVRLIDLKKLDKYYPSGNKGVKYSPKEWFLYRMKVGTEAVFIDKEKKLFPREIFEKVGEGGNCCVVTYVTYNHTYPQYAEKILPELKATGFNGYFLCKIGGYPTPTGKEAKYAAVPYAFKIPMVLEAFNRDFENVLWIDSAWMPIKNLGPIFDYIEKHGCFFAGGGFHPEWSAYLFPKAREELKAIYGNDPLDERKIGCRSIGFSRKDTRTWKVIAEFYRMMELGTPFISQLPEQFVLSSILGHVEYGKAAFPSLYDPSRFKVLETTENRATTDDGIAPFFFHHVHNQHRGF